MRIDRTTYWRRQLRRTGLLLVVWAVVGFGCSILFVEQLNTIRLGDMPLGFWMAQQGSIYVFIVLILLYAILSGRADREAGLEEERLGRLDASGTADGAEG
jgi:putative solute:sodium symporter small subunit